MATRRFDLTTARAVGDAEPVHVAARKLVIKRVDSPVTLIIERDNNDPVTIAAGETRTLTADDCKAIGPVHVVNEAGTGELELYWSSIICMSAESGKAEGVAGDEAMRQLNAYLVTMVVPATPNVAPSTEAAYPTMGGVEPSLHTSNFGGPQQGNVFDAPTGRFMSAAHSAAGALTGWQGLYFNASSHSRLMVDLLNGPAAPARRGVVRFSGEMWARITGAGAVDEVFIQHGLFKHPGTGVARGIGLLAKADGEVRAWYQTTAGVVIVDEPLGVNISTFPVVAIEAGDLGAGPFVQLRINGEVVYSFGSLAPWPFDLADGGSSAAFLQVLARKNVTTPEVKYALCTTHGLRVELFG